MPRHSSFPTSGRSDQRPRGADPENFAGLVLSCIEAKFATKYAFEISRRDLRNALLYAVLQFHFVVKSFPPSLNFEKILVFGANSEKLDSKILSVLLFFQVLLSKF